MKKYIFLMLACSLVSTTLLERDKSSEGFSPNLSIFLRTVSFSSKTNPLPTVNSLFSFVMSLRIDDVFYELSRSGFVPLKAQHCSSLCLIDDL